MLTKEWLTENMPEKVETLEDYAKVEKFLMDWREMSGGAEGAYTFISTTSKSDLKKLSARVWNLANSFLDFCIRKYNMLSSYLQANQGKLPQESVHIITRYGDIDIERSKAIAEALKGIATMLEI